jgi:dihydrofolate reductase
MHRDITIVLAVTLDGCIARPDGALPVHDPEDLRHFRTLTMGTDCVVGRVTADTLPVLKGRRLLVMSGGVATAYRGEHTIVGSVEEAISERHIGAPLHIIGGAQVYELWADIADGVSVTWIPIVGGPGWVRLGPRMLERLAVV